MTSKVQFLSAATAMIGGLLLHLSSPALAMDESRGTTSESGWEFTASPFYGWLPGVHGNTAAFGSRPVQVSLSPWDFGDALLENLDFAFIGAFEARRDNYGLLVDVVHMRLSTDKATPGPLFGGATVGIKETILTGMGSYRVVELPGGHLDLLAGARLWHVDLDLNFSPGILAGRSFSDGDTWIDPMVGFKGTFALDDRWSVSGWGMVGAGQSDISWDVYAAVNYQVDERLFLLAGYRAAGVDYQSDGFLFDIDLAGPMLGAVLKF